VENATPLTCDDPAHTSALPDTTTTATQDEPRYVEMRQACWDHKCPNGYLPADSDEEEEAKVGEAEVIKQGKDKHGLKGKHVLCLLFLERCETPPPSYAEVLEECAKEEAYVQRGVTSQQVPSTPLAGKPIIARAIGETHGVPKDIYQTHCDPTFQNFAFSVAHCGGKQHNVLGRMCPLLVEKPLH